MRLTVADMKYQVTFRERNDANGNFSENPPEFVDPELIEFRQCSSQLADLGE